MLVSLTVGKVDAGVAVLLTEDKRLIEFPSILLPPDIHSGSIVDINVSRNQHAELIADQKFSALQNEIFQTFGQASPTAPVLRCRNTTQTSIVLEWDPIELATADLRSLSLYRNGTKAGVIPRDKLSTKISGLALDTEYTFHLVLRTSAGQYTSEKLTVRTHKMTDLSGITITPGVMPGQLRDSLAETVNRIGAKMIDTVRIDTTHFVCTEPRGQAWEKAVEMNVPVVVPDWVKGCEREGKIVGVRGYYLDADPKHRQMGPSSQEHRGSVSSVAPQQSGPRIEHTPPTPERATTQRFAARQDSSEAPTPPPKPVQERISEEETPQATHAPVATQEEKTVSPLESDEEESDDEGQDPEKAAAAQKDAAVSPVSPSDGPADEDGKFDEVAL
ncbi:chitin biosynthesis protein Chs5 [Zymoseptoria brevis]|uniref:Chitin biosynthesis protein Chs5 n=1 Tax=Zymoseptoria brevis TaxID=1047168 RepID=A0A0F4GDB0_9PEZI|nr:chitin biosynthesis protein Chs5 [Zymoseptoria brevis]